jgi:hypothetical protein
MTTLLRPIYPLLFARLAPRLPIRSVTDLTFFCRPFSYDHVVIGAGVMGLAVAAKLAEYTLQSFQSLCLDVQSLRIW